MNHLALFLLLWSITVSGQEIPRTAVVRFNTVCANCHEGECSGRLSFQSGASAARNHMQRYLGAIDDAEAAMFGLLRHAKEMCVHYPLSEGIPADSSWAAADLKKWHDPRAGAYFVPLGSLPAGRHRLRLTFNTPGQGRLKITDQRFEPVLEEALCPQSSQELSFAANGGPHFLTLHSQADLQTMRIEAVAPAKP
jgi:hypothetical protein